MLLKARASFEIVDIFTLLFAAERYATPPARPELVEGFMPREAFDKLRVNGGESTR
jgi:hypothetical protein